MGYRKIYPRINANQMYYNWCKADSFDVPLNVVVGKRGIGKTFGLIKRANIEAIEKNIQYVYVVENKEQVKTLSQNAGSKFFEALIQYAKEHPKTHNGLLYKAFVEGNASLDEDVYDETKAEAIIKGGAIRLNGNCIGYILAWDDFANLKRNNFSKDTKYIIIDEFMPEIVDINSMKISRKIISLIQSIARTRKDIKIYMMSNSLRRTDPILDKLECDDLQLGEARLISDKYGPIAYVEYVNPADYVKLNEKQDESVAGRLAVLFKEDNLDKNIFRDDLTEDEKIGSEPKPATLLCCLHGESSVRISITKDHKYIYVTEDYGRNATKRFCVNKKYISPNVRYSDSYKDYLTNLYNRGMCKFESTAVKLIFLDILNLFHENQ